MDRKAWLTCYESSPEVVQDYLLDQQSVVNETAAREALAYDYDAWARVMDVVWDAVFANLSREDFQARLMRLAGDRKPDEVERMVLLHVVLPLADLVNWDVEGRLEQLGVSLADRQNVMRISLRPVSYGAAVRRIAATAKVSILAEELFRRLREVLVSYLKGVRTIEQVKEILQRSQAEGGIGLNQDQTNRFTDTMLSFLLTTRVMTEQEYADWLTQLANETKHESSVTPQSDNVLPAEDGLPPAQPTPVTVSVVDQAIDDAVKQVAIPNLDEYLTQRLRNVVSTRLRDVRNALQTKSLLARDVKVGGMGLEAMEVERVAQIIEQFYVAHRGMIEEEEKRRIERIKQSQAGKVEERKKRESEEHARWFEEKVQGQRLQDVMRGPGSPGMVPGGVVNQKGVGAQVSYASATLGTGGRSLDGIQAPRRLVSLADELEQMTLADFRRMAKSPDDAIKQIQAKFESLRRESFDRWTEGVEAWRHSPLQQQYLKLVADSFAAGRPVAELVQGRRAQDPSLPSPAEIGAIVALNSQLQF